MADNNKMLMYSTPAMFMSTVTEGFAFDASVMITASHLPFNRNGYKFFTKDGGLEIADKVHLQLQLTDPDLKSRDRVVKKSEKDSLYAAIDVGSIWLERALAGK